jgi:sialate O-acetylesterase
MVTEIRLIRPVVNSHDAGSAARGVAGDFPVRGQTLVVTSPEVSQPIAGRYGWANIAEGNLFNQAGLPATPFRTDVE